MNCQSCGMPLDNPDDHGGGDINNPFCRYCTDENGNLLSRREVRAKMIHFFIQKQGKTQEEAEALTDKLMSAMPAWREEEKTASSESTDSFLAEKPTSEITDLPSPDLLSTTSMNQLGPKPGLSSLKPSEAFPGSSSNGSSGSTEEKSSYDLSSSDKEEENSGREG